MRRVLNRSLYSAGIVTGVEVEPDKSDIHRVIVRDGLAFDNLGREIFLPTDVSVLVNGTPSSAPGVVFGNLLVVSYRETRKFPGQRGCVVGAPCGRAAATWRGARRRAWSPMRSSKSSILARRRQRQDRAGADRALEDVRGGALLSGRAQVRGSGQGRQDPRSCRWPASRRRAGQPQGAALSHRRRLAGASAILPARAADLVALVQRTGKHGHDITCVRRGRSGIIGFAHTHTFDAAITESGDAQHSYKRSTRATGGVEHVDDPYKDDADGKFLTRDDSVNPILAAASTSTI